MSGMIQNLKENWKLKGRLGDFFRIVSRFVNRFAICDMTGTPLGQLVRSPNGWYYCLDLASSSSFSVKKKDSTKLEVTIRPGYVVFGAQSALAVETVVSVGGTLSSPHFIFASGTINPLTIVISPNTVGTLPVHAVNQWRRGLIKVYVASGSIVIPAGGILWDSTIDLTSFYGP